MEDSGRCSNVHSWRLSTGALSQMIPNSLLTDDRLGVINRLLEEVSALEGSALEVGCFQCGLLAEIGRKLPHKSIYGFDTFEGLPIEYSMGEFHHVGEFSYSLSDAWKFIVSTGMKNIGLHPGLFPASTKDLHADAQHDLKHICFAHIDVDYGQAITECLEWIAPRVVHRGVIVIDDYGNENCPNVKPAVDAFWRKMAVFDSPESRFPKKEFTLYRPVPWQAWLRRV